MSRELEKAAQAIEAERYRPMPKATQSDDDRLLDAFLTHVLGEGGRERLAAFRALRRIVARLRRESGDITFTDLVTRLVNAEAAARGFR